MESPSKKILNAFILLAFLLILFAAFEAQRRNFFARLYAGETAEPFNIVFLSEPALILTYNPETKIVNTTNASLPVQKKSKLPPPKLTPQEEASRLLAVKNIKPSHVKYVVPLTDSETLWSGFKTTISSWRYTPLLGVKYLYNYAKAYAQRRTDIRPHEFLLLTLGSLNLEMTDFSVTLDALQPKSAPAKIAEAAPGNSPLTAENRPLIVEIYNASGQKGEALALTQYLRGLNEKKLLNIDVLQYDNNPKTEEQTKIIDYSGRSKDLKSLSLALGLKESEFFQEKNPSAFCDAKILIGKDFKMPK